MFNKLLQHLVQFSDDIHNENLTTVECGILSNLQAIHTTPTTQPTYSKSSDIPPSPVASGHDHGLDPLMCLHQSSQFHMCQKTVDDEALCSKTCTALHGTMANQQSSRYRPVSPFIGSGLLSNPPGLYRGAFDSSDTPDPYVGSPPFASGVYGYEINQFPGPVTRDEQGGYDDSPESKETLPPCGLTENQTQKMESIFSSTGTTPYRKLTNVFVANFPAHWGKSDLVDLFEGIPIASVHVLPEKHTGAEEGASGGTGFVNVIRHEDAEALLGLLDKKIWLIEGSALKFRLANSSAPNEAFTLKATHKNRTIRRHPFKILDRLRAEQTIRNRQAGACDKHQIVVYKNISLNQKPTLSVVHSSRQRNNHMSCANLENTSRPPNQRNFIDDLRSYLNRSNKYNQQQTSAPPPPTRGVFGPLSSARKSHSKGTNPLCASASSPAPLLQLPPPLIPNAPFRTLTAMPTNSAIADPSLLLNGFASIPGFLPQAMSGGICYLAVYQPPQTITTPGYYRAVPYAIGDENNPGVCNNF